MKSKTLPKSENPLNLRKLTANNSPMKHLKFKTLLKNWEDILNPELTTAVAEPSQNPNLDRTVDSQSEQRLENLEIMGPSAQLVIGLENSRQGGQE